MTRDAPVDRRLLIIDEIAELLRGFDACGAVQELPVFGTTDRDEIQLRTLGPLITLLLLHPVDDRGRCRRCRPTRRSRCCWLRWPSRRTPCQISKVARFFSSAPLDEVWLRLLPRIGIRRELNEIRANLANQVATGDLAGTAPSIPAQADRYGRHALRTNDMTV
ncbi:hypothetical protein KUTG_05562 [Kutzneria sp. 744]|nr:hypothetical protein KUTG_05562 [Kutzneria sp. 744]